ncbi:hypothetical protein [Streptomyces sp. OE57]|uniref:hypothetical protein n=1 Tax=Streptomyces lacaronensis TaxID=3379885 RepID=UPI0039B7648D
MSRASNGRFAPRSETGPNVRSPDGIDLTPGTLFADILGWVDNGTEADRIRPTIVEMFRERARTRPDAVAIVDEHRSQRLL